MRAEFANATKLKAWQRARGKCEQCNEPLRGKFHYDHITPAAFCDDTSLENCQVLCLSCHGRKTVTQDVPAIAKSNRIRRKHAEHLARLAEKGKLR